MNTDSNLRPEPDRELVTIADYLTHAKIESEVAYQTARYCLMDAIGCAIKALQYPACTQLLGPLVPGTLVPNGARVPGTTYELDPVLAAFNIGAEIRWLDFNDTWLAAEWGHPSDNLGSILAVTDYISRSQPNRAFTLRAVLTAMIKAYEIQGILALENSFNRLGLDHVVLVKIASAAVAMQLLGGSHADIVTVLTHVFMDGQSLRTYRHAPNTGPRKSWAAGDATSRAVQLAYWVLRGEKSYPSALSVKTWGFNDVLLRGKTLSIPRALNAYVMENILFKVAYPAEFHAQTAVECGIALHPLIQNRLDDIQEIVLTTQESAIRIISKEGPLYNPADRDHSLQYMVAAALLFGDLRAEFYEDNIAQDPRIDALRAKMKIQEDPAFSKDYLNPEKRSIANAVQIYFNDGTSSEKIQIDYPLGHKKRRGEGVPLLFKKFAGNMAERFSDEVIQQFLGLFQNGDELDNLPVTSFMEMLTASSRVMPE